MDYEGLRNKEYAEQCGVLQRCDGLCIVVKYGARQSSTMQWWSVLCSEVVVSPLQRCGGQSSTELWWSVLYRVVVVSPLQGSGGQSSAV